MPQSKQKKFIEDLTWFQDEYAKGEASKYYAHASCENGATIDAFIKNLGKKEYSHLIELSKMSEYLHKIYG